MLNKKPVKLILYSIPSLIVLFFSAYYSYYALQQYQENKTFLDTLNNVKNLQKFEESIFDASLCQLLSRDKNNQHCKKEQLKVLQLHTKLLNEGENLQNWLLHIERLKKMINSQSVNHFENILKKRGTHSIVNSYLDTIKAKTNLLEKKELLRLYENVADISYSTTLERFLVAYYLKTHTKISPENLIFWDKIVEATSIPTRLEGYAVPSVKQALESLLANQKTEKISSAIDDMRISILTGQRYKDKNNTKWITWLKEKEKLLESIKRIIEHQLEKNSLYVLNKAKYMLLVCLIFLLLVFLSLWGLYLYYKNDISENKALLELLNKINALTSYSTRETEVMQQMLANIKNKEDVYAYLYSSFQLLNEKYKQSKDDANIKSQFISTLSHEIRTPLNGIIGFSQLLKEMGVSADKEEFLSLIESSSQNLLQIVNDVLNLSKMNADKIEIEYLAFDIVKTVETTVAPFVHQADQKDIELGLFIDPFLRGSFLGDAVKLTQVLTNLIGNAIKFTEAYGKINIFVQNIDDREDEASIKFAVNDNGIGLSETQMQNIFDAFAQGSRTTSQKYGGTGLGLNISSKMVDLMGGILEVESEEGEGASFYFTLHLKKDKEQVLAELPRFPDTHVGLALPVKGIKRQIDTNLEIYMRHLGVEFSYYYYDDLFGNDTIVSLPDIMIFDHQYARLSGELEQCASLHCKTILLTSGTLYARIDSQKHVFDMVVLKPISLEKSIRILENQVENQLGEKALPQTVTRIQENSEQKKFEGLAALVADDNMINRKLIKILLENLGLCVTLASNGNEVFEAYKNGEYDIIFMDIQMPVMDGLKATKHIIQYEKEHNKKHTPIVAVTANVAKDDQEYYKNAGMDDYTTKPLVVDALKQIIMRWTTG